MPWFAVEFCPTQRRNLFRQLDLRFQPYSTIIFNTDLHNSVQWIQRSNCRSSCLQSLYKFHCLGMGYCNSYRPLYKITRHMSITSCLLQSFRVNASDIELNLISLSVNINCYVYLIITWTIAKLARKRNSKKHIFNPISSRHSKGVCKSNLRSFVLRTFHCKSNCSHLKDFHMFRCFCRDCQSSDPPLAQKRKEKKR